MGEGRDMAAIIGGGAAGGGPGGGAGGGGPGGGGGGGLRGPPGRPVTRPPPNLPPAGRPRVPAAAVDSLDAFLDPQQPRGGGLARDDFGLPNRWALPPDLRAAPPGGGGGGGGGGAGGGLGLAAGMGDVAAQVAQMQSRLGHLEQENAVMKRTMDMRDAEVRKAAQLDQVVKGVARQMSEIDETLRRASNAHDGAARRIRALEDAVGYGNDTGGAHAGRLHTLEESLRAVQAECQGLASELGNAAGERAQAAQAAQSAVDDASGRLAERLEQTEKTFSVQLRAVQDEGRAQDEGTKAVVQQLSDAMSTQFAEVNGDVIPGIDRALREQLAELRRVVESSVTQVAEDLATTREGSERGRNSIRQDLKELQGVAQKGLLTLRAESEKQGKTLASIVKEEIATRTLNFETVNKQIEEVRLQLDADMTASGNDLNQVRQDMQSQFEMSANALDGVREELETFRGSTLDTYLENLRGEMLSVVDQRHGTCMETVKGYGLATEQELRQVANRIVKEEMTRAEADSDEMKALEQLREQVNRSVEDWHTAMDKFDAQHAAEQKKRIEAEGAIKLELEGQVTNLRTKTDENYEAQLVLLEGVRDELHAKVDQTATNLNDTISLHKKEADRAIDRATTSAESRADSIESALERDVASVRGELSGVEEELTKLQDESRQTLIGFREYMDTEFESAAAAREEMRDELKQSIESSYQDSKNDCEFAVKDLEDRTRNEMQEEISSAKDELQDELKEVQKELSSAIHGNKLEIQELSKLTAEMQGMRVRVTANAVSITSLDAKVKADALKMMAEIEQQRAMSDATLTEVTRLVADTNETMVATTTKLLDFESSVIEHTARIDAQEEQLSEHVSRSSTSEQSLRVQGAKLEERLNKRPTRSDLEELSMRLEQQAATQQAVHEAERAARVEEASRIERGISARKAEVDKRLGDFGRLLSLNSDADEADKKEMIAKICAILPHPELGELFRRPVTADFPVDALVPLLEEKRAAVEATSQQAVSDQIRQAEETLTTLQGTLGEVQTAQQAHDSGGATKEELAALEQQLKDAIASAIESMGAEEAAKWEKHAEEQAEKEKKAAEAAEAEAAAKEAEAKEAAVKEAAAAAAAAAESSSGGGGVSVSDELASSIEEIKADLKARLTKAEVEQAIDDKLPGEGSGLTPTQLGERLEVVEKGLSEKMGKEDVDRAIDYKVPADGSGLSPKELGTRVEELEKKAAAAAKATEE